MRVWEKVKKKISQVLIDWYRYLDTSYPKDVNRKYFNELRYGNRRKRSEFLDRHPEVDVRLLENMAWYEFLHNSDEAILERVEVFKA